MDELLAIRKHLFKNVYEWAGSIRTVDIKKNTNNSSFFLIVNIMTDALNYVFTELAQENFLKRTRKAAIC